MLAKQLIQSNYPSVHLTDKVSFALRVMEDYDLQHIPVINDDKYIGIVSKDDLLDVEEAAPVASLQNQFAIIAIKSEEHFITALKAAAQHRVSIVAVVNEQLELQGVITLQELVYATSNFLSCNEPGGIIVLETEKRHFSFGEISRLVETNDAYITQLNTYIEAETGLIIVTIKVNTSEISDIIATLQRFDYAIRYYFGEEQYANELKDNFNQLMFYLNM
ncbi:MAG: CBS domain-containing protein [Chitinophagaceae bacterium]|nr:CBS domain-containing protein [Chitinophagaceae bacterium]MCW5904306.1 CBS domain-containing protein [Chitinophagaceae bacterium]